MFFADGWMGLIRLVTKEPDPYSVSVGLYSYTKQFDHSPTPRVRYYIRLLLQCIVHRHLPF